MQSIWVLLIGAILLAGCQHARSGRAPNSAPGDKQAKAVRPNRNGGASVPASAGNKPPRASPIQETKGKVAAVNANLRFVVIDFFFSALPQIGQRMSVYRQGFKVGEVRISGPERSRNIAADIVAGEAQPGDEVRPD